MIGNLYSTLSREKMQKHTMLFRKILNITLIINIDFFIQRRVVLMILCYILFHRIWKNISLTGSFTILVTPISRFFLGLIASI